MLRITFADADDFRDPARFSDAYARISAARRERVDRLCTPAGKRLSLAAGFLLAEGLDAAGVRGPDAEIALGAYGKPCLPRRPEVHFSLSHSGTRAMCVFADRPVGCDIQHTAPRNLRIARRFFSEAECARIFSAETEAARQAMFFRIWALKESFVKCIGLGFELPLDSFSILPGEDGAITLTQSADPDNFVLSEIETEGPYRCACCLRES